MWESGVSVEGSTADRGADNQLKKKRKKKKEIEKERLEPEAGSESHLLWRNPATRRKNNIIREAGAESCPWPWES